MRIKFKRLMRKIPESCIPIIINFLFIVHVEKCDYYKEVFYRINKSRTIYKCNVVRQEWEKSDNSKINEIQNLPGEIRQFII